MNLQFDEDQELLQQSLDRYLENRLPVDIRREQRKGEDFCEFWRQLDADLGIASAGLAEKLGGFAGGSESEMIVASSLGRALAVTPYITSHILSANLLAEAGAIDLARAIAKDGRLVTTAIEEPQTRGDVSLIETSAEKSGEGWTLSGTKLVVDFSPQADLVLIPARLASGDFALFALEPATIGSALKHFALIDDTPSADIVLDKMQVPAEACIASGGKVLPALQVAVARALAALCAEASGVATVLVADTVAYTKEREQFGVPISSFQALQHRMVDMWSKAQEIEAASLLAALKVDQPAAIAAAKATVSDGIRLIGQEAVQLHGAMGLTEELRVGHYFKRATVLEHKLGAATEHVERYRRLRQAA
jgi:alkylation response protein AidB-like acyl-CoA dehydrogenase